MHDYNSRGGGGVRGGGGGEIVRFPRGEKIGKKAIGGSLHPERKQSSRVKWPQSSISNGPPQ